MLLVLSHAFFLVTLNFKAKLREFISNSYIDLSHTQIHTHTHIDIHTNTHTHIFRHMQRRTYVSRRERAHIGTRPDGHADAHA